MSFTSTPVAGGTTGSLADAAPAIDRIGGVDFQRVKLADATADATTATGVDANPLVVKNRRRGTSDYDSGLVSVNNGAPASVTSATIYPEQGYISNPTAGSIDVTLQNTAGTTFLVESIGPKSKIPFPLGGSLVGLKAGASATGLVLHLTGAQ